MSFIEKVAEEGLVDYLARRIAFILSIVVLAVTISFLFYGQFVSGKNVIITVALLIIAIANFVVALVMFIRYENLKKSKNIKYTKVAIKVTKLIVNAISCILTIALMIGENEHTFFMNLTISFLIIFYVLSFFIQSFMLFKKYKKLKKSKR